MKNDNQEIYRAIFEIARMVPEGRVTSYGAIAKAVGLKSGARMVARAMSLAAGEQEPIHAHRIVSSSGFVVGDHGHRERQLLNEGIEIRNNKIVAFKKIFWDPLKEIE